MSDNEPYDLNVTPGQAGDRIEITIPLRQDEQLALLSRAQLIAEMHPDYVRQPSNLVIQQMEEAEQMVRTIWRGLIEAAAIVAKFDEDHPPKSGTND